MVGLEWVTGNDMRDPQEMAAGGREDCHGSCVAKWEMNLEDLVSRNRGRCEDLQSDYLVPWQEYLLPIFFLNVNTSS